EELWVHVQRSGDDLQPHADDLDVTFHGRKDLTLPAHYGVGGNSLPDLFTFMVVTSPTHGSLSGTGQLRTYTPSAGFVGDDAFTFTVTFAGSTSKPATVHLHVTAGSAPSASDLSISLLEGAPTSIQLYLYASDPDSDVLSYAITTQPSHGTVSAGPTATYQPAAGYHGPDSFRYSVSDGLHTSIATVSITVIAVNHAPIADAQTVEATEDVPASITLTGRDPDGDALYFAAVTQPGHGSLSGSGAALLYTPSPNFNGTDSFTFRIYDANLLASQDATVTIHVAPVADAPIAGSFDVSTAEDTPLPITLRGSDPDGKPIQYQITGQPVHGTLTGTPPALTYTPAANYNGADSFSYVVSDDARTSAPGRVSITVTLVNDPPVAQPAQVTTAEDTPIAITLTATDSDSDVAQLTYSIYTPPAKGTLSGTPPDLTYTPNANFTGVDVFEFRARDGVSFSAPVSVTITVTPVDDPPTPADDYAATDPGRALTFDVLGNDTDPEGDAVALDSVAAPAHGELEIVGSKLTYTPAAGFTGLDTFTYTVTDPSGLPGTATIHMGVGMFPSGAPVERLNLADAAISPVNTPMLSGDSRFIVFTTGRSLVTGDTGGFNDVYLYDRGRRELARISVASDGTQANASSQRAAISSNGRYVVYESLATNLVAGDTNGAMDVFRYDRTTGQTIRISVASDGGQGTGASSFARISDDGDTVAFLSDAFELVANDTNGARDAFVHTVSTGVTERVSLSNTGGEADLGSVSLALSGDGHVVAFESPATNLVAGDGNARNDVFVRDRVHATTVRASVGSTGVEGNGSSVAPSLSFDGRFVLFASSATNLVAGSGGTTLYVRDTQGSITTHPAAVATTWGWLSGDGRYGAAGGGPTLFDRFAARSQGMVGGAYPVIAAGGRYAISAVGGQTIGVIIIEPNPF
ncbi:MAG TPA: Ig-like domain-containing protein, partial [Kofleriaceae bacterium]